MIFSFSLLFFVTVLAPAIFWLWFFNWQDRAELEPKKLLFKTFLLGIGICILASVIETEIISKLLPEKITFFVKFAAIVLLPCFFEELLKYFTLREFIYRRTEFNQIADGIFYAITLALGFSVWENAQYFYGLAKRPDEIFVLIMILRGMATMLLHITATGMVGYALGKKKFTPEHKKSIVVKALIFAILLHGLFNLSAFFSNGLNFAFPMVFLVFIYLLYSFKKTEAKIIWKLSNPFKK